MLRTAAKLESMLKTFAREQLHRQRVAAYLRSDRRPWCYGYNEYKELYLRNVLNDDALMQTFRAAERLSPGYGFRLDERVLEIPWALAHLTNQTGRLLDAGSSLNHEFVLKARALANWKTTIVTLGPEGAAYWSLGVSYVFGDLRNLDFRDEWFDAITCISTIEHVGMDNSMYADMADVARPGDTKDFMKAITELKRVLKPGGVLYVTFPFGKYENHGFFQQFDAALMDLLIDEFAPAHLNDTFFRYDPDGWKLSDRDTCSHCEYFNVHKSKYFDPNSAIEYPSDYAAGVRAVACLELRK